MGVFLMVSHVEWRDLCTTGNKLCQSHIVHVRQIRHLMCRFNPLEEYDVEEFRLRVHLRKGSVSDHLKFLDKDIQHQTKGRSAAYTNAASANCFEILCDRNFSEG